MKAVSLFAGAGGMDVGAERAGFSVIAASELDPTACATYRLNHPESLLIEGDINRRFEELRPFEGVDLLVGGPPCQGFSVAGKMDLNDPRSQLVFTFCEAVEALKPRAFVMENVKSLGLLEKFQSVRETIVRRMKDAGYQVTMNILNAKDYGVPQSRERVFFIGIRDGEPVTGELLRSLQTPGQTVREAIAHLGRAGGESNPRITKAKITLAANPVLRRSPYAGMLFNGQGRPLDLDGFAKTLPASMGGNRTPIVDEAVLYEAGESWVEAYHHQLITGAISPDNASVPDSLRRLTVDEAIALQTFPADYQFTGTQSKVFSQIGNAVPCNLAEAVCRAVASRLNGEGETR